MPLCSHQASGLGDLSDGSELKKQDVYLNFCTFHCKHAAATFTPRIEVVGVLVQSQDNTLLPQPNNTPPNLLIASQKMHTALTIK